MTKERLSQLHFLKKEIEMYKALKKTDEFEQFNLDRLQRKAELENELLITFIEEIEDSMLRQIFFLRYLNGLSWQKIAFSIGEYDESYPRRKHNAYLKKKKKKES